VLCYFAGNFRGALNAYSRALQHAPDSARVLVNAALMLLKLSQPDDAHEKATLALGLQPRNAKAYHARHKAKEALGDFKVRAAGGNQ
jgi:tetratricopeptide (TPR) repeat protein